MEKFSIFLKKEKRKEKRKEKKRKEKILQFFDVVILFQIFIQNNKILFVD